MTLHIPDIVMYGVGLIFFLFAFNCWAVFHTKSKPSYFGSGVLLGGLLVLFRYFVLWTQ